MRRTLVASIVLSAVASLSGGCLVMSANHVDESGVRVSARTLEHVETGQTTERWLVATLGEPTSRSRIDDRTEVLRYEYRRETSRGGAVFLLFGGMSQSKEASTTFFEVTDGVVTRHWTETGTASRPKKVEKVREAPCE